MPVGSISVFNVVASKRIDFEKSVFWYMLLKSWFRDAVARSGVAISLELFPFGSCDLSTLGGVIAVPEEEFMVAGEAFSEPEFILSFVGEMFISLTGHELPSSNPGLGFAFAALCLFGREPKLLLDPDAPRLSGEFVLLAFSDDEFIRAICTQSVSFCSYHTLAQSRLILIAYNSQPVSGPFY